MALSDVAHVFDDGGLAAEMVASMRDGGTAATLFRLTELDDDDVEALREDADGGK